MQTFLPFESFLDSAECLDNRRLGKQRVECLQILRALTIPNYGWKNHPAVKMWRGHEFYLRTYGLYICQEWKKRGFRDTCLEKIQVFSPHFNTYPDWLGNAEFHASHRSNLLRKDFVFYSKFDWTESTDLPYVWPVK